jgi:hypothetical protein
MFMVQSLPLHVYNRKLPLCSRAAAAAAFMSSTQHSYLAPAFEHQTQARGQSCTTCRNRHMRPDGRDAQQIRAMACETKTLSMLDGSARYSHQGSCVLASVTGPIEAPANKQRDRAVIQVFGHVPLHPAHLLFARRLQLRRSPSAAADGTKVSASALSNGT